MTADVSVVMSVFNGERWLQRSLKSVQTQSLQNFEFVIVNDASEDSSLEHLTRAARADRRIRLISNERNLGLTRSLNIALEAASGRYIARMDADDVCLPDRLAKQLGFLEQDGTHCAVACGYRLIDDDDKTLRVVSEELDDWQIRWLGGFNPPAPHPTFFFRRIAPDGSALRYDESFATAQDFDLWSRLAEIGKTHVLPDVLVHYRRHPGAITVRKRKEQAANCARIGTRNLQRRLPQEVVSQLSPLISLFSYEAPADTKTMAAAIRGCDAMIAVDQANAPSDRHRCWLRRTASGLLADAVLSRGKAFRSLQGIAAFLFHARHHLPGLIAAVLADPRLALKSIRATGKQ